MLVEKDPEKGDIIALTYLLRQKEREELRILHPYTSIMQVITESVDKSEHAHSIYNGNRLVGIYGFAFGPFNVGVPWALFTDEVKNYATASVIMAKRKLQKWSTIRPLMCNIVWEENVDSIHWLSALGARFQQRLTINDHTFFAFYFQVEALAYADN